MRKVRKYLLWGIITVSLVGLIFSPINEIREKVAENAPWVGVGFLLAESLFILGLVLIALAVGRKVGNPFKLRKQLKELLLEGVQTRLFWAGFFLNAVGAIGTGVVVGVGIMRTLPPQSWGLIVIPFLDLGATVALRVAVAGVISETRRCT